MRSRVIRFLPFLFIVLLVIGLRLKAMDRPLDRDEGEYAYAGWRSLQGDVPYRDYYNMKMPGIYAAYSVLFVLFGTSVWAIRLGLLLVNLGSAALIFFLGKQVRNIKTGIYASTCFLIFSSASEMQGMSANAEHFAVFFVLLGLVLFFRNRNDNNARLRNSNKLVFFSGLALGIAFIVKQPSASFVILVLLLICIERKKEADTKARIRSIFILMMGVLLPFLATLFSLFLVGAANRFFYFTFQYAREYISFLNWKDGVENCLAILKPTISHNLLLWVLVAEGILIAVKEFGLLFQRGFNEKVFLGIGNGESKQTSTFVLLFFLFSLCAVCAGNYFRPHYFQYMLPAVSFLVALTLTSEWISSKRRKLSKETVPSLAAGIFFSTVSTVFFYTQYTAYYKKMHEPAISSVAIKVGEVVSRCSNSSSTVAIFGAEPEIWFYARRKAASGYLYVYPFLEGQKYAGDMLKEFYQEIKKNNPDILVYTSNSGTWAANKLIHDDIYLWYKKYSGHDAMRIFPSRHSSYRRVALIDMINNYDIKYYSMPEDTLSPSNEEDYIEVMLKAN